MTKIRITFLLLAVALLLPLALLVRGAFQSVREERELRHQAIAERIFDEMERELTAFLQREEARSVEQVGLLASGGAEVPHEPFIGGYFELRADGTLDVWPEASRERMAEFVERLRREGESGPPVEAVRPPAATEQRDLTQRPGTTVPIKSNDASPGVAFEDEREDEHEQDDQAASYSPESVLRQLNRGAYARKTAPAVERADPALSDARASALDERSSGKAGREGTARANEAQERSATPMTARLLGDGHLFLWRTVTGDDHRQGHRQGLALQVPSLFAWLNARVIESSQLTGLARLLPESAPDGDDAEDLWSSGGEALVYRYQFDEPFTEVAGLLSLDPLPASGGASYLRWLSALVIIVSTLGLLALYRMVTVAVGFAERQQNFVSAVTHELKTPLTAIRLYGEMLRDGLVPDESKRRQYFSVITAESERLTRLVNNVLELAKLQRKEHRVSLIAGPIEPVLRDVVDTLEPHARNEGFEMRVKVPPDLPDARFDRDALQQVLFNLIDNAIKYAKDGPKRLIRVEAEPQDSGVSIAVVDHGPGVSERHVKRVFEPFVRGERELTRTTKGTGIGLALVRGLVGSMDGDVTVQNRTGGGFQVRVTLPLATTTSD